MEDRRRVISGDGGNPEDGDEAEIPAAAEARQNENGESEEEDDELLQALLGRICNLMPEKNSVEESQMTERARRLLEASCGDLDLAADLYWDDYLASHAVEANNDAVSAAGNEESGSDTASRRRLASREEASRRVRRRRSPPDEQPEENAPAGDGEVQDDTPRRVWRRLVPHWLRQLEGEAPQEDEPVEAPVGEHHDEDAAAPEVADQQEDGNPVAQQQPQEASVSVSDDENESAPIMSIATGTNSQGLGLSGNPRRISDQDDELIVADSKAVESDVDEDYLSDSDWVLCEDDTVTVQPPLSVLWGGPPPQLELADGASGGNEAASAPRLENNNEGEEDRRRRPLPEADHVVAEDDEDDDEDDHDEETGAPSPHASFLKPWLNAGFTFSTCATGLIFKPPTPEEITLFRWRQSQSNERNQLPPPYHCRGMTALLSVVTALIYSGASVQGQEITDGAGKKPFAELPEEDRKREFESRLADALTVLLFLAAKVSLGRKKRALVKRTAQEPSPMKDKDGSNIETELLRRKQQTIQRRLMLCPTCRWEDDASRANEVPENEDARVATSHTNLQDLRYYVLSSMKAFISPGGCALFLENIVRIHGKSCVERMLRCSRRKAGMEDVNAPLIVCTCRERQADLPIRHPSSSLSHKDLLDTTPPGHSCMSTELLSLLLTGKIRSSLQGWSTDGLGIGILSNQRGEIGMPLMKPAKPVWILRGETCYSVLWHDSSKEKLDSSTQLDRPGMASHMSHWNCWYGQKNKSDLRIITGRSDWAPPTFHKVAPTYTEKTTITQSILKRRQELLSNIVSSDEQAENDAADSSEPVISSEEIDRVKVHPDDMKFYPDKYRHWRFDMGDTRAERNDGDKKIAAVGGENGHWIPYFRLNRRQQLVVELKLAPKINRIIWTRWPGASVQMETPEPVV